MSEGSFWPKTWIEALPLMVWGILIFAAGFEGVASLVHGEWVSSGVSFAIMFGLTATLLHWKSWLETVNPNWVAGAAVALIIAIAVSPFVRQGQWPAASWGSVGMGVLGTLMMLAFVGAVTSLFIAGGRPAASPIAAPQAASAQIDTQTRLDLIHLLDFALNQSALVLLSRLTELASSPEVTDAFRNGENSPEAQQSRQFYIGYVGQEIAGNFDRRQSYLGILANAEAEVDRLLEGIEDQRLPGENLTAFRRRLILERQFQRAIQFLHHQKREVEDRISGQRSHLAERLHYRQQGSIGGQQA
jgi:hypothetical protein